MEEERIINGFCKARNDIMTIFCEYDADGKLIFMDCSGQGCDLKESCENYRRAISAEE